MIVRSGDWFTVFGLMITLVAVSGGIAASILRTIARHRAAALAMRERIAAFRRAADPDGAARRS